MDSVLRGYHIYKDIPWDPAIGTTLPCKREAFNLHDPYAATAMNHGVMVGHVSRSISAVCSIFLQRGGIIFVKLLVQGSTPQIYLKVGLNCHASLNLVLLPKRS